MKLGKFLSFAFTSITAGLAAAIVLLVLRPDLLGDRKPLLDIREAAPPAAPPTSAVLGSGPVSYADAVTQAAPAVVNVYTAKLVTRQSSPLLKDPLLRHFFGKQLRSRPRRQLETSLGSGVIISPRGYVLTNNHVIEQADEIQVVLASGDNVAATVVGRDPDTDLAVLRIRAEGLPSITVGDSARLRVGDVVLTIGNPFGVGKTVTMGIVSATGRNRLGINTFEDFIQTDAAINPGNSGGALINARGELIGINTAIFSKTGGSQGIGFAIPMNLARGVMEQIVEHGRVIRGWLGIQAQDITKELAQSFGLENANGILVAGVLQDGPADRAGLKPGDVITRMDGIEPEESYEILNLIARKRPGSRLQLTGRRGGEEFKLEAVIAERPLDTD